MRDCITWKMTAKRYHDKLNASLYVNNKMCARILPLRPPRCPASCRTRCRRTRAARCWAGSAWCCGSRLAPRTGTPAGSVPPHFWHNWRIASNSKMLDQMHQSDGWPCRPRQISTGEDKRIANQVLLCNSSFLFRILICWNLWHGSEEHLFCTIYTYIV